MEGLASLLPFVLIAAVFWLLLIRPQRRRQQDLARTQGNLEIGDEVMIGAGIVGHVAALHDAEFLELETSPGIRMKVARGAVVRVLHPEPDDEQEPHRSDDESVDPGTDPTAP